MGEILFKAKIDDWLWARRQAGVLGSGAKRSIQPFTLGIDGLDLDRAIEDSDLYALRINPNPPYRDEWLDAARHPTWQGVAWQHPRTHVYHSLSMIVYFFSV